MEFYYQAVQKAVEYIEAHLRQPLKLEAITQHVTVSYYHFHRMFCALTGETLGDYIRKRRLTEAACELLHTHRRILDIALEFQFESQEAFSRSFKGFYGMMPGTFRKKGIQPYIINKESLTGALLQHRIRQIGWQPEIVYWDKGITIGGLKGKTSLKENRIPALWADFIQRGGEIENPVTRKKAYGISSLEPESWQTFFTEETEYLEVVGIEVDDSSLLPEGMIRYPIEPGYFAVFLHKGEAVHVIDTYKYIYGTWVFNTPYELAEKDHFEVYGEDYYGPENKESLVRIFIPIKKPE